MRVLVIGGGIAGMATAIALEQAGLDPLILEQSPRAQPRSASGIGIHAERDARAEEPSAPPTTSCEHGVRIDTASCGESTAARRSSASRTRRGRSAMAAFTWSACTAPICSRASRARPAASGSESALVSWLSKSVPTGVVAQLRERRGGRRRPRWSARTGCAPRYERSCSASSRHASPASPRGGGPSRAAAMPPGFEPHSFVDVARPGRHGMTFPIRPDLQTFNGFVPTTEILREEWGPSGDLDDLRRSFAGATSDVLRLIDRMTSALITPLYFRDPLPRVGNRARRAARRCGAPDPAERRPGRRTGAGGRRDARCLPATRRRPGRRAGGARRVRGAASAAHRRDADLRPRATSRCSTSPTRCRCGHGTDGCAECSASIRSAKRCSAAPQPRRDRGR